MSTITIPKILANFETSLAATMSAAATSLTLNASVDGDGTTLSGLYSLTFDEGTSSEEHMLVTMTGASGAVSRRGLSRVDAFTEVSANKLVHNRGASAKVTNVSAINIQRLLNGDETFNSVAWTGVASIAGLSTPGAGEVTKAASVAYVNAVAIAGASDATTTTKGIVEEATQAEIAAGTAAGATAARLFTNPSTLAPHIQSGAWLSAVEDGTGSDDTYTAALTPALTAYTTGMVVTIKITVANTGACTLNLNGLGAKNIKKYATGALADPETGDIVANQFCMFYYDGTQMVLINPGASMPTTALLTEMGTFFGATDITGAEAETLTSAASNNADTLHSHAKLLPPVSDSFVSDVSTETLSTAVCSFSDATPSIITYGHSTTFPALYYTALTNVTDYGTRFFTTTAPTRQTLGSQSVIMIGAASFSCDNVATAGDRIQKNGSIVTISGTTPNTSGKLAHDPTNSYLLVLDSTTTVLRYSGIAGTTITFVSTITLDTAVTRTGFLYDNTNARYICLDTTANVVRRFNSSGVTVDTAAYTCDDTNIVGLAIINSRVHLANVTRVDIGTLGFVKVQFIPTTMTI